ncbi:hypothetical protein Dalu01_01178 [Deinococcus aluminii]|uniref:Uncharacterized protein n=1 Tax=Deinococcus aluminii TaxID=1656885 RepID=A0ABP9XBP7_9DEIO
MIGNIDPVFLDAAIAGYLTRFFQNLGVLSTYNKYQLGLL